MKPTITNIPQTIFLQVGEDLDEDVDFEQLQKTGEVSWCWHRVFETDIEYTLVSDTKKK